MISLLPMRGHLG